MKLKTLLSGWILGLFALGSPVLADDTKESGEKGGTQDINIGVGELQEDAQEPGRKKAKKKAAAKKARKKAKKKAATKKMRQKKKSDAVATDKEYVRKADGGETTKKKKGNVEYEWKVEEGEK